MKKILAFIFLITSSVSFAEICTSRITDRQGIEYETFTRSSYNQADACDQALWECRYQLTEAQRYGRYQNAYCEIKNNFPPPPPTGYVCQTDLVDYYGSVVRMFTAPGASEFEACNTSDMFCKSELARHDSYGSRCVTRGLINQRPDRRNKTEQCSVNRYDPAGMFIQTYTAQATGPINSDVRALACNMANRDCKSQLRGRQFCREVR